MCMTTLARTPHSLLKNAKKKQEKLVQGSRGKQKKVLGEPSLQPNRDMVMVC